MKPKTSKKPESVVREIKRKTRRKFNPEERIRIILEGLKGEVKTALLPSAVGKASPPACITSGANHFWRPANSA